jgi:hypothetical protein
MLHEGDISVESTDSAVLRETVDALLLKSSLGTPEALRLRSQTPCWLIGEAARRAEELAAGGANHIGADLTGADLTGAQLQGADLTGADLTGADLTGAQLQGADLTGAQLQGADLTRADLAGAILLDASLDGARFHRSSLEGAALTRASIDKATFLDSDLSCATLHHASLRGGRLVRVDLSGADLRRALLEGSIIKWSNLNDCDLGGALFWGADVDHVDLSSCVGLVQEQLHAAQVGSDTLLPDVWLRAPRRERGVCIAGLCVDGETPNHAYSDGSAVRRQRPSSWMGTAEDSAGRATTAGGSPGARARALHPKAEQRRRRGAGAGRHRRPSGRSGGLQRLRRVCNKLAVVAVAVFSVVIPSWGGVGQAFHGHVGGVGAGSESS